MIRPLLVICALCATACAAEEAPRDILRFATGDQLQGVFGGISEGGKITWSRPDVPQPIEFQRDKVRQIVLHDGHPLIPLGGANHVAMVNGDRLPGKVLSMDEKQLVLATEAAGSVTIPRDAVSIIAPNPFGGRMLYAGPFSETSWTVVSATPVPKPPLAGKDDNADGKPKELGWRYSGAAWLSKPGTDGLQLHLDLPDKSLLRFKLSSRGTPGISIAFDADFASPILPPDDKSANNPSTVLSRIFGNAYVLAVTPNYAQLYRCGYDKDGHATPPERLHAGSSNFNLKGTGDSLFELRRDRKGGTVALYIDGDFALQWETKPDNGADVTPPGGTGVGFQANNSVVPIRLSDIVAAEWNGLTDSARSMESDQSDIILLSNGTDRFSGHVTGIQDGKLSLDGKYAGLSIPLDDVAELHLARSHRRKEEEPKANDIVVHFQPVGRLTGTPLKATPTLLHLESSLVGSLDLDLKPAVVLEFQSSGGFLDKWDDDL